MAVKDMGVITVTFKKTTVAQMRNEKRGMSWDSYALHLLKGDHQGAKAECVKCGQKLESEDVDLSPRDLARINNWSSITVEGSAKAIGFICNECILHQAAKASPGDAINYGK